MQEVVARWVFVENLEMRTEWGTWTEFVQDSAWATKVAVGAELRVCGGVGRVWRKALVEWRRRQVARATEEMWGLAVAEAVEMCGRHRYPKGRGGVPAVTELECALWVEGRCEVVGRFARTGSGRRHWLSAEVWKREREGLGWLVSGEWRKKTAGGAWWRRWQGWDVCERIDRWEAATERALGAWVRRTAAGLGAENVEVDNVSEGGSGFRGLYKACEDPG